MLQLHVVTPLFTGAIPDKAAISKRLDLWLQWQQTDGYFEVVTNRKVSICAYYPGTEIGIPHNDDPEKINLVFPSDAAVRVPKGLVARLHLLVLLERNERDGANPDDVIFACIDGSGAFRFDSLRLLIECFEQDSSIDVVFGRRPMTNCGMPIGRKEIEEFEQFLLFHCRSEQLRRTFSDYDLSGSLLPDGQAGCWGFRLRAANRLPLTASGYAIEYDLLASTVEGGLRARYTEPLLMSDAPRHSTASAAPVDMSIKKLGFIERKLRITRQEIADAWRDFQKQFADSPILAAMHPDYEKALLRYCLE